MVNSLLRIIKVNYESQTNRHAIKTAIAAILAVLIYQFFNLPKGYWAVITAVVIMQSNIETGSLEGTIKAALQRLLGTISGALVGFGLSFLVNQNYIILLVLIFALALLGAFFARLYKGFALSGPTAVIVLLFAHQGSITQSVAFFRVSEILLGILVAIIVTICIWPYRVMDHIKQNQQNRILKLQKQFQDLNVILEDNSLPETWNSQQDAIIKSIISSKVHLDMANNKVQCNAEMCLESELQLAKSIKALARALSALPKEYWQFNPLKSTTQKLMLKITTALISLTEISKNPSLTEQLSQQLIVYDNAFNEFRVNCRSPEISMFSFNEVYELISVRQSFQLCVEYLLKLEKALQIENRSIKLNIHKD